MGGRVEVTDRLVGVAPEVALRAPIGELGVTLAGSREDRAGTGGAAALGWSWRGRVASVGATMRGATEEYRSVGVSRLFPAIRHEVQAYGGVSLPRGISVVLQHAAALDWAGDRSERSVLSASMPLTERARASIAIARSGVAIGFDEVRRCRRRAIAAGGHRSRRSSGLASGSDRDRRSTRPGRAAASAIDRRWRISDRFRSVLASARACSGIRCARDVDAVVQVQGSAGRVELRHATVGGRAGAPWRRASA